MSWYSWCYIRVGKAFEPSCRPVKWEGGGEDVPHRRPPTHMSDTLCPEYWRQRAERVRKLAEELFDQQSRETLVRIANNYELLAKHAQEKLHIN